MLCKKSLNPTHGSGLDGSDPAYRVVVAELLNPPNGSWGIVQIRPSHPKRLTTANNSESGEAAMNDLFSPAA
ncbi:MAG: hypothetical protein H7Z16_16530 [Pyrinomonadaceae bacterium]|nr:hypothetical protein [Pyrinomonadaceae bacterium]